MDSDYENKTALFCNANTYSDKSYFYIPEPSRYFREEICPWSF